MTAAAVDHPPEVTTSVRVVVVDDTPTLRMLTRLALENTGFEVVGEAGDGLAGVNLVAQLRPDLVLLDLAMPVMDGLEALPLMRSALPSVRVVIVSGFDRKAMERQVLDAGADAYLQKGTPPEETLAVLRSIFPRAVSVESAVPLPRPTESEPAPVRHDREAGLEEELEELLYIVSHDLAEPVHVIKGFAQRLARRANSEDEAEFCEFIIDSADRMQRLLDDLLLYARAGQGDLPQELLDGRRLVSDVLAGLGTAIDASSGRVTTGDLPREIVANRLVLNQVLHNLVANALKFVAPGTAPQVHVDAVTGPGAVVFRVRDNGIGIAPEQFERIFLPFKRLHHHDRYPGSGIGLAICRRFVERHGGRIWVESDQAATTFFVEIAT